MTGDSQLRGAGLDLCHQYDRWYFHIIVGLNTVTKEINMYVRMSEEDWEAEPFDKPTTWKGFPVNWHFDSQVQAGGGYVHRNQYIE
ncbi:hypothetical protein CL634_08475 [bacterium]|nr:hypothetical protein [bacterium]